MLSEGRRKVMDNVEESSKDKKKDDEVGRTTQKCWSKDSLEEEYKMLRSTNRESVRPNVGNGGQCSETKQQKGQRQSTRQERAMEATYLL